MRKIFIAVFLSFTLSIGAVFAISANSAQIVDNFKARHEKILFETLPLTASGANDILEYEYRLNGLEALQKRLLEVQKQYEEKKEVTTRQRISLENAILTLNESIRQTEGHIEQTKLRIYEKGRKIQILEKASLELKKKIASHRKTLLDYLANMYSEGNFLFDDEGNIDMMKTLILTGEDTDYYLTDLTYKTLVSELGQKFVDEYRTTVREYHVTNIKTQEERISLQKLQSELEDKNNALVAQRKQRETLLEITKGQEALYVEYINAQQQSQKQVSDAWKKASEDYQKSFERFLSEHNCNRDEITPECIRLRQFFVNEQELARSEYAEGTENIFVWPTQSRRVSAYFRDPGYYQVVGSHHDAVDIATNQGSEVYSVADGYVYYIIEPTATSYSYVAIRHKNGLVSVYGHLSKVEVAPYQFVRQGELIALSGGAPGTPGAGPMTTGAHLHFEVWKNREPVDPMRFLSLADIDYKTLPATYQTKFLTDIVEKTGNSDTSAYKVRFSLKGETEEDRQKYLLSTYATKPFQDWSLWTDTAIAHNIDPSFLMCIGLSETTLGNHLKTPNNIGNVGNTDSGATITFATPKDGIVAMAKTFNNRYLGKYTKISELSRWGNKTGPIYASSSSNWHDNSIRCLSALKGRFVEDNFEFRLKK